MPGKCTCISYLKCYLPIKPHVILAEVWNLLLKILLIVLFNIQYVHALGGRSDFITRAFMYTLRDDGAKCVLGCAFKPPKSRIFGKVKVAQHLPLTAECMPSCTLAMAFQISRRQGQIR